MFETLVERDLVDEDIPHLSLTEMAFVSPGPNGSRMGVAPLRRPLIFVAFHWGDLHRGLSERLPSAAFRPGVQSRPWSRSARGPVGVDAGRRRGRGRAAGRRHRAALRPGDLRRRVPLRGAPVLVPRRRARLPRLRLLARRRRRELGGRWGLRRPHVRAVRNHRLPGLVHLSDPRPRRVGRGGGAADQLGVVRADAGGGARRSPGGSRRDGGTRAPCRPASCHRRSSAV